MTRAAILAVTFLVCSVGHALASVPAAQQNLYNTWKRNCAGPNESFLEAMAQDAHEKRTPKTDEEFLGELFKLGAAAPRVDMENIIREGSKKRNPDSEDAFNLCFAKVFLGRAPGGAAPSSGAAVVSAQPARTYTGKAKACATEIERLIEVRMQKGAGRARAETGTDKEFDNVANAGPSLERLLRQYIRDYAPSKTNNEAFRMLYCAANQRYPELVAARQKAERGAGKSSNIERP